MYIHPGFLVPRPSALRRDLDSRFELQKGQAIVFPRIVVGFFGVKAVVNYDVQGRFLHDVILVFRGMPPRGAMPLCANWCATWSRFEE
jgi:hypothetical protein